MGVASIVNQIFEVDAKLVVQLAEIFLIIHTQQPELSDHFLVPRVAVHKVGRNPYRSASLFLWCQYPTP